VHRAASLGWRRPRHDLIGAAAAVFGILSLIGHPAGTSAEVIFVSIVISLVAVLIVWHVLRKPRGAESRR